MKSNRTSIFVALALLCSATLAFAVKIRGSSGNGQDSNAVDWLLLGRSTAVNLAANGKSAKGFRETICLQQDVEATLPSPTQTSAGSCDSGQYMFLFQLQSTSTNVNVAIGKLSGFNPLDSTSYGVMICDPPSFGNTIEMCTNATQAQLPAITATAGKTAVTFTVPGTFPSYPAGTAEQGQGLTFFVITQQSSPLPLAWPTLGIH